MGHLERELDRTILALRIYEQTCSEIYSSCNMRNEIIPRCYDIRKGDKSQRTSAVGIHSTSTSMSLIHMLIGVLVHPEVLS